MKSRAPAGKSLSAQAAPLLALCGVSKTYETEAGVTAVLEDIHLNIDAGEMVAIVGQSGSGKSTLMHLLGCLDRPSAGTYTVGGQAISELGPDALALLRREHFGFIFQRYHLLADLDARENIEMPGVYLGMSAAHRQVRAQHLLARFGLTARGHHRPSALSGGQQQRVSIARALMNGGNVILADEPTGALDSASGAEVLAMLRELHLQGHTVIIVTHDMNVAHTAERIVELRDGKIVADRRLSDTIGRPDDVKPTPAEPPRADLTDVTDVTDVTDEIDEIDEIDETAAPSDIAAAGVPCRGPEPATKPPRQAAETGRPYWRDCLNSAWLSLARHRLRTFLTMLSVTMGIASVVSMAAVGAGVSAKILQDIRSFGGDAIYILPGKDQNDRRSASIQTLIHADVEALQRQPYVGRVSPEVRHTVSVRQAGQQAMVSISGVNEQFLKMRNRQFAMGADISKTHFDNASAVAVLDHAARMTLFPNGLDPIGKTVLIGRMHAAVIGVLDAEGQGDDTLQSAHIYVPASTLALRVTGQHFYDVLIVKLKDGLTFAMTETSMDRLLMDRHGVKDFHLLSFEKYLRAHIRNANMLNLLMIVVAVISLTVAGIGVMNIMLVSVTERTNEIGIRMAVGARQRDIRWQFMTEAVLVCTLGGALGIVVSLLLIQIIPLLAPSIQMQMSMNVIVFACFISTVVGIGFGYFPARNAARLDPVQALAHH